MATQKGKIIYYKLLSLIPDTLTGKARDRKYSYYFAIALAIENGRFPRGLTLQEQLAIGWL